MDDMDAAMDAPPSHGYYNDDHNNNTDKGRHTDHDDTRLGQLEPLVCTDSEVLLRGDFVHALVNFSYR